MFFLFNHFFVHPANERWHYTVTPSFIGWGHTQNEPCACNKVLHCDKYLIFYFTELVMWCVTDYTNNFLVSYPIWFSEYDTGLNCKLLELNVTYYLTSGCTIGTKVILLTRVHTRQSIAYDRYLLHLSVACVQTMQFYECMGHFVIWVICLPMIVYPTILHNSLNFTEQILMYSSIFLNTESHHGANSVITCGTVICHKNNIQCHQ